MRHSCFCRATRTLRARRRFNTKHSTAAVATATGLTLAILSIPAGASEAERRLDRELPAQRVQSLRLPEPRSLENATVLSLTSKVDSSLRGASGVRQVVVRLRGDSVGRMKDRSLGSITSRKRQLQVEQDEFIRRGRGRAHLEVVAQTQSACEVLECWRSR